MNTCEGTSKNSQKTLRILTSPPASEIPGSATGYTKYREVSLHKSMFPMRYNFWSTSLFILVVC